MKNILSKVVLSVMALSMAMTVHAEDYYTGKTFVSGSGFMYAVEDSGPFVRLDNTSNSLTSADMGYLDGTPLNPHAPSGLVRIDNDGVGRALRETFTRAEMQSLKSVKQVLWINIVVNSTGNIAEVGYTVWNSPESRNIKPEKLFTLEQKIKQYVQYDFEPGAKRVRYGGSMISFTFSNIPGEGQAPEDTGGGSGSGGTYEPWIPPVATGPIEAFKLDEGVFVHNNTSQTWTIEVFIDDVDVGYDDGTSSDDNWSTIVQIHPMTPQYQPGFTRTLAPGEEWILHRGYHVPYTGGNRTNWVSFVKPGIYFDHAGDEPQVSATYFLTLEDANGYNLVSVNGGDEIWGSSDRRLISFPAHYGTVVCPSVKVEIELN